MDSHPIRLLRSLGRSSHIAKVLFKHGFADLLERMHFRRYFAWSRQILFWRRRRIEPQCYTRAQRIRMALEDLGPTFIKFGQVLSTRPDIIPADIVEELALLQEHVPTFSSNEACRAIEQALGSPREKLFRSFDKQPFAAGSLAQVHRAVHWDGTELAVKIRRPNVVVEVERDIVLMSEMAILFERHLPEMRVFDPVGLVAHFARTIRREMNFTREARSLEEFRRLFHDDASFAVPEVYRLLSTESVLTMKYVDGCRIDDYERLKTLPISPSQIAANGALIFMKQAFELGIFHGDPHPGNIRILEDGSICLLDYGMIGILEDDKRDLLVDLILSVSRNDVGGAVSTVERLGHPARPLDIPLLKADLREFVETWYGLTLEQMNLGAMLSQFVDILSRHAIRYPPDLMLLIRAIVTLEGVGRDLDPQFNLAEHLQPYIERVVRERYHPRRMWNRMCSDLGELARAFHDLPIDLGRTVEKLSRNELRLHLEHESLDHLITELDRSSNRVVIGLVVAALVVASALVVRSGAETFAYSVPIYILSSLLGVWLIYGVFRSGRL